MARDTDGPVPDVVRDIAVPLAAALDIEILDVEVGGPRSRPLVRVVADAADPTAPDGLDVEDVATLSRQIGAALDDHDLFPGPFTLEVTSPGADRPLTSQRDFQRNVGRDVRLTPTDEDASEVAGRLTAVDDASVTLDVDGQDVRVALDEIDHGKVVLPW